jgi:hypothetical protein
MFQRVSSVQEFESADTVKETEVSKERSKKMQKIGYKGDDAIEADEVRRPGMGPSFVMTLQSVFAIVLDDSWDVLVQCYIASMVMYMVIILFWPAHDWHGDGSTVCCRILS